MNTIRLFTFLLLLVLFAPNTFCQVDDPSSFNDFDVNKTTTSTKAPEASNLSISGKSDVDLYTGRAVYSIPLYTLQCGELNLPISINYSSSGVLVDKVSDWVGIDWNLNAGGSISRKLNGLPDETPSTGYFVNAAKANNFYNDVQTEQTDDDLISLGDKIDLINKSYKNEIDLQPDEFYYNFGGYSGKFVFDADKNICLIPKQPFQISYAMDANNRINGFTVVTPDGTIYTFGINDDAVEITKVSTFSCPAINKLGDYWKDDQFVFRDNFYLDDTRLEKKDVSYSSSWHLSKIESPRRKKIDFTYQSSNVSYVDPLRNYCISWEGQIKDYQCGPCGPSSRCMEKGFFRYVFGSCNKVQPEACPVGSFDGNFDGSISTPTEPGRENLGYYFPLIALNDVYKFVISQTRYEIQQKRISKISTSDGNFVDFIVDPNRLDLPGASKLKTINIYDFNNTLVKTFNFTYDNVVSENLDPTGTKPDPFSFGEVLCFVKTDASSTLTKIPANIGADIFPLCPFNSTLADYVAEGLKHYNYNRLFLKSITESVSNVSKPSYIFNYITPEKLQRRTSTWVDYWGYNNESDPNLVYTTFETWTTQPYNYSWTFGYEHTAIDGTTDYARKKFSSVSHSGLLNKVTTPLGGEIVFKYEDNYDKAGNRVKQVIENESPDVPSIFKNFKYSASDNWIANVKYKNWLDFFHEYYGAGSDTHFNLHKFKVNTSYNQSEMLTTNGSFIGYGSVEVNYSKNDKGDVLQGKEVYEFTKAADSYGSVFSYPKLYINTWDELNWRSSEPGVNVQWTEEKFVAESGFRAPYPLDDMSYKRGLLKTHTIWNNTQPIKEITYNYVFVPASTVIDFNSYSYAYRKRVERYWTKIFQSPDKLGKVYDQKYKASFKTFHSDSVKMTSSTEKSYDPNDESKYTTNQKIYSYHSGLIRSVTQQQSDGNNLKTVYTYSSDYPGQNILCSKPADAMAVAIDVMKEKNILSGPVEVLTYKNGNIISGDLNLYRYDWTNNLVLTDQQLKLDIPNPVLSSAFTSASVEQETKHIGLFDVTCSKDFIFDSRYSVKSVFDQYDNVGNLLQYHKARDINTSIIYGYNQTLPIAKVLNATSNQIAYTSFEDATSTGGWTYTYKSFKENQDYCTLQSTSGTTSSTCIQQCNCAAISDPTAYSHCKSDCERLCMYNECMASLGSTYTVDDYGKAKTGEQYFKGYDISISNLSSGNYKVSCWLKNSGTITVNGNTTSISNNGWDYKEFILNGVTGVTIGLSGLLIDELRLCPVDAQMTTYTYKPLVGMTSQTNEKNVTTYYEYDSFGRLQLVKDQDGKILKTYEYKYANE